MSNTCESCFEIQEQEGTEEFIQCAHESVKATDSMAHKIGNRFAGVDSKISALDNRMETAEGNITTLQSDVTDLINTTNEHTNQIAGLGERMNTAEGSISELQAGVSNLEGDVLNITNDIENLDNRTTENEKNITIIHQEITNLDQSIKNVNNRVTTLDEASMKKAVYDPAGGARQVQFEEDDRLETEDKTVTGAINSLLKNKASMEMSGPFPLKYNEDFQTKSDSFYWKDDIGLVSVTLSVKRTTGNLTSGVYIATLPIGFRPAKMINFSGTCFAAGKEGTSLYRQAASIAIFTNGEIQINMNDDSTHCVGSIVFTVKR